MVDYSEVVEKCCSEILDIILPDENNEEPIVNWDELVSLKDQELTKCVSNSGKNMKLM